MLVKGKFSERSETSDSEKLLVLDKDEANLFTDLTRSISLPNVETTLIDGVAHYSTCVLSDFLFRHRSEASAFCMMFFVKDSGYPAFLKQSHNSLRRCSSLSWLLMIFRNLKQPE